MSTNSYVLSETAEKDVSDIYDYTLARYGSEQAIEYVSGLHDDLADLVIHPKSGLARNEVRADLRSRSYEQHVVFYSILDDHIRIVRVLHGSRDLPRIFDKV